MPCIAISISYEMEAQFYFLVINFTGMLHATSVQNWATGNLLCQAHRHIKASLSPQNFVFRG